MNNEPRATRNKPRTMPNFLNNKELNSAGFSRPQPESYELRSTLVERPLQFQPFFAKRTQFPKSQVFTKYYITRTYESWTIGQIGKTNPKRTQNEPNTNPIRTQSKPIKPNLCHRYQTQFQSWRASLRMMGGIIMFADQSLRLHPPWFWSGFWPRVLLRTFFAGGTFRSCFGLAESLWFGYFAVTKGLYHFEDFRPGWKVSCVFLLVFIDGHKEFELLIRHPALFGSFSFFAQASARTATAFQTQPSVNYILSAVLASPALFWRCFWHIIVSFSASGPKIQGSFSKFILEKVTVDIFLVFVF